MRIPKTATVIISIVTGIAWLLVALLGRDAWAANTLGFVPLRFSGVVWYNSAVPPWLTPLTSTLVHGNSLHLLFNLLTLVWCGTQVERVLGRGSLILLYVVGAFTAAVAQWMVTPQSAMPMIGASGAISAIIGAFALSFGQQKKIVRSPGLNRSLNALWLLATWIAVQAMLAYLFQSQAKTQNVSVAWAAHIGGFIAGILLQRPLLLWRYRNA